MKKILSVMLMFVLLMSLMIPAYANSDVKEVEVVVSVPVTKVNVGESVTLSAVVSRHGSTFADSWTVAEKGGTTLDEDSESYISTANFKAAQPGTYTIEYNITMQAGKSSVLFIGKGSVIVEVVEEIKEAAGPKIEILSITTKYKYDGSIYYKAEGVKYVVNGGITTSSYISINFGINDEYQDVNVIVGNISYCIRVERVAGIYISIY